MFDFAYLDAGSGSLILQAVLGGLAGIAVAFKAWKARMAGRRTGTDVTEADTATEQSPLSAES